MKLCDTCGNDIEDSAIKCPFCEELQSAIGRAINSKKRPAYITINIKEGSPTVDQAISSLETKIKSAIANNTGVVRVIHGYGSSGRGGDIRINARATIATMKRNSLIKSYICGEDYSRHDEGGIMISKHPELKNTLQSDRRNPGITFVELQ